MNWASRACLELTVLPDDPDDLSLELLARMRAMQDQHRENCLVAEDLKARWATGLPQGIQIPIHGTWFSGDGVTSDAAIIWTDDELEHKSIQAMLDLIGKVCVEDIATWVRQYSAVELLIRDFFRGAALNLITVTPKRLPRHLWVLQGRPELSERLLPESLPAPRPPSIRFKYMSRGLDVSLENLLWAPRPNASLKRLRLQLTVAHRVCGGRHSRYLRLFEIDPESDARAIVDGFVPAIAETISGSGTETRTNAPMVQLWRLFPGGRVDVVNLGLSRGSGRIADIRTSSQLFWDAIMEDPHYAQVITETLRNPRRLLGL